MARWNVKYTYCSFLGKSGDGVIGGRCCALTAGRARPLAGRAPPTHHALSARAFSSHNSKGRSLQGFPQSLMGLCSAPAEAKVIRYHLHSVRPAMGGDGRDGRGGW